MPSFAFLSFFSLKLEGQDNDEASACDSIEKAWP
jgi:hypothetical protein